PSKPQGAKKIPLTSRGISQTVTSSGRNPTQRLKNLVRRIAHLPRKARLRGVQGIIVYARRSNLATRQGNLILTRHTGMGSSIYLATRLIKDGQPDILSLRQ